MQESFQFLNPTSNLVTEENAMQNNYLYLTVCQVLSDICIDPKINDDILAESFFSYMANIISKIRKHVSLEHRKKLDKIVDSVKHACMFHRVYGNDKKNISELFDLEKEMETISQRKLKLFKKLEPLLEENYNFHFEKSNTTEESNVVFESQRNDMNEQVIGKSVPSQKSSFSSDVIVKARDRYVKKMKVKLESNVHSEMEVTSDQPLLNSNETILKGPDPEKNNSDIKMPSNESFLNSSTNQPNAEKLNISPGDDVLMDKTFCPIMETTCTEKQSSNGYQYSDTSDMATFGKKRFKKRIEFSTKGPLISCLKIIRNLCFAGSEDGLIIKFGKDGHLMKRISPHSATVSSLIIWGKRQVMTTSLDGSIAITNKRLVNVKKIEVEAPLTCSREFDGIFYVGTTTGHIFKYNIRALTRIGGSIQVSSYPISDFEVFKIYGQTVFAMSDHFGPVKIRDTTTGCLFINLQHLSFCNALTSKIFNQRFQSVCGVDHESVTSISLFEGVETLVFKQYIENGVSHVIQREGLFYCSAFDGNIYVFGEKGKLVKKIFGTGELSKSFDVDDTRIVFATSSGVVSVTKNW